MEIKESRSKTLVWIILVLIILGYLFSMFFYSSVKKLGVIISIVLAMILLFLELRKLMNPKILIKADKEGITNTTTIDFKTIKWSEISEIYVHKKTFLNKTDIVTGKYICFNLKNGKKNKNKINIDFAKKYKSLGMKHILITGCNKNAEQVFKELKAYYEKNIKK